MRAWIIITGLFIAIAIRPELDKPGVMGKWQAGLLILFLFGGLYMDVIEFASKTLRQQESKPTINSNTARTEN